MTPTPAEFKSGAHVGRFAPSPTGPLHFGSLVAAFGSFLRARSLGGRWLLRIEDIDTPRVVPGAAQMQMDALLKLGLEWDGDPMWQSQRDAAYRAALQSLQAAGLVFACRCSRSELAGEIHRQCVSQRQHGPAAIRLRLPDQCLHWLDGIRGAQQQNLAQDVGDVVLWRADGLVAYQLAVVVDDAEQGITDVVRGADLLESSARQIHLHRLLGHTPPAFAHLPLALDAAGHKLGKSQQALAIKPDRPMPLLRAAWAFLGQNPVVLADVGSVPALLDVAIAGFDWSRVPGRDQTITELAE
ncbi:MAG TPA: tRNA glutamyl-Q(34) synthetase GluQRS [Chiayiivirga sp.]|nr:tRNA glutamyl-Q(34) synthetase GluQRS [Chiayiivirga sp.]